ncbi:MAG: hypothetical protein ACJ8FS_04305 [Sphingomicrobium sp.]
MSNVCQCDLDTAALWVDRRELLSAVFATSLSGCVRRSAQIVTAAGDPAAIGDAHVHLFNGADLPVSGFFKNVLIPNRLADWPNIALSLIDMALNVLQASSKTAIDELRELSVGLVASPELSAAEFARRVAARADSVMRGAVNASATADPRHNLADSYAALADLIDHVGRGKGGRPQGKVRDFGPPRGRTEINTRVLAYIAENGAAGFTQEDRDLLGMSLGEVLAIIAWAFRMTHSRRGHLHEYLRDMSSSAARPTELINLLVDYDLWLDDRPLAGSDHSDQVRFWTRYAQTTANDVRIHTFAGFDPLKHAFEKRKGSTSYLDERKRWALGSDPERQIAGFKLYPPMGFSVWKDEPFPSTSGRAAAIVENRWKQNGWDPQDIPGHIDDALDDLFAFTTKYDIPLLAHGRNSEEAFVGAGLRAHPKYWLARARSLPPTPGRAPLRACVAHYRREFNAGGVVRDILDLNLAGAANIYFDFAFEEEVLDGTDADQLLADIAAICSNDPRRARYFMYGSDWIMLAQLPHANRYLHDFDAAIRRSRFWAAQRQDVLAGNLRRFLRLAPA